MLIPELPEVKTIQDQLNTIMPLKINSFSKSNVSDSIIHTKVDKLKDKVILEVSRKGKMLDFILNDGRHILSHLGMTGTWLMSKKKVIEKHTHFQIKSDDYYLAYVDPRRFGHMYLYEKESAEKKLAELGHDLLSPDFTEDYFFKSLRRYPERMIKVTLLDQSLFAGTGNYIASEICAHARVLPSRKVSTLTKKEIQKLYNGVFKVINPSVANGGAAFAGGYRDATGDAGQGVKHLVVFYQKECQMCKKSEVLKTVLAQRGTYHCPRCQK